MRCRKGLLAGAHQAFELYLLCRGPGILHHGEPKNKGNPYRSIFTAAKSVKSSGTEDKKAQIINRNAGGRKRIATVWKNINPGAGSTAKKYSKYIKKIQQ